MKTLNIYITKNFLLTLVMAVFILTFVLMLGSIFKIFEVLLNGMPLLTMGKALLYTIPISFSLALPFATLISVLLVFGRLSADNEITAIRASGISILQIIAPLLLVVFILTAAGLFLQLKIMPEYAWKLEQLGSKIGVTQPLVLFEEGREIRVKNLRIRIDERIGENEMRDIDVYNIDSKQHRIKSHLKAKSGKLTVDKKQKSIFITLNNAFLTNYGNNINTPPKTSVSRIFTIPIKYGEDFNNISVGKRIKYLTYSELYGRIVLDKNLNIPTTRLELELNKRIALAFAPIAFLLLGLPLAIRTSRKETSIGIFISIILAGVYFAIVLVCDSLHTHPEWHPQVILWIPNIVYQLLGICLIYKMTKH